MGKPPDFRSNRRLLVDHLAATLFNNPAISATELKQAAKTFVVQKFQCDPKDFPLFLNRRVILHARKLYGKATALRVTSSQRRAAAAIAKATGSTPVTVEVRNLHTMPYTDYLNTPEWQEKRQVKLAEARRRCQVCNSGKNLQVHHRTYDRRGHEDIADLTVLCDNCHSLFHGKLPKEITPAAASGHR